MPPNTSGTIVSRTSRTISRLRKSFWPPAMTTDTSATVPSTEGCVSAGPLRPSTSMSRACSVSMAACVAGWSAWVTTTWRASVDPSGHFSSRRFTPWTASMESGNEAKSLWPRCSRRAGTAIARSNPAESTKAITGRRMTARTTVAHTPLPSGRSRPRIGMRSRSTPSPRMARVAGRNVSEPMTAISTTAIVPMAIDWKRMSSSRNSPAIENMTASPEKNTARPAVAEATRMASGLARPCRRSVRKRVIMNSE